MSRYRQKATQIGDLMQSELWVNGNAGPIFIREDPKPSGWKCEAVPGVIFNPPAGKVPNRFWRLMQRLIFGFKWEKSP